MRRITVCASLMLALAACGSEDTAADTTPTENTENSNADSSNDNDTGNDSSAENDNGNDNDSAEGTTCDAVTISDSYAEAVGTGECSSEAGLRIADSLMNLDGATIDNNGEEEVPCIPIECDDEYAYIVANGLPHYDFVQTTPNALAEDVTVYRIPLVPSEPDGTNADDIGSFAGCETAYDAYISGEATNDEPAGFCQDGGGYLTETLSTGDMTYAKIPCLGSFGTSISGVNVNGPNEAVFPDPWGDPAFSYPDDVSASGAALDFCGGHTGGN
ncbi:MAG: hypothetical protein AAFY60_19135, partial [Myxococcota bacterium]